MSYCTYCTTLEEGNHHKEYHDKFYGFPLNDDSELFGRLILEINQAGLSWDTILKKESNFRSGYAHYDIEKVASFNDEDKECLLQNPGIIRNRLKIEAAIYNAKQILQIQQENGSFDAWLKSFTWEDKKENVRIFKKKFKFVGGEIVNEFLMSAGYKSGAHEQSCPIFAIIEKKDPFWLRK